MPADVMVATSVLALVHVPPVVASLNVVVAPVHTVAVPVIEAIVSEKPVFQPQTIIAIKYTILFTLL
jgi:hypothetical protein